MALGFKTKTVKTKNTYTIDTLFEAIKDKEFSAGKKEAEKLVESTAKELDALGL